MHQAISGLLFDDDCTCVAWAGGEASDFMSSASPPHAASSRIAGNMQLSLWRYSLQYHSCLQAQLFGLEPGESVPHPGGMSSVGTLYSNVIRSLSICSPTN